MDSQIDLIKNKIDIVEFIGSYTTLKKAGRNFKANCPFHKERSPSFVVSPERQLWHCFGACGDGGDVIKFLMKWENITFFEAIQDLAKRAGVQLQTVGFEDKEWSKKERLVKMNYLANEFFQYVLYKTPFGKKALDYLETRKLREQIIKKFEIGYAPVSWDSLLLFLKKKGYSLQEMFDVGLVVKNDNGHYYDRFRGRIMFPIKDIKGNIIGFSGRLIDDDNKGAKYVNTPESPIYHKRESLYGIHITKEAIKKNNCAVLVEGEFDLIVPYQFGIEHIIAIKGSALTLEQLTILKRLTTKIIFAFDTDEAGLTAIMRGIDSAEKMEFDIYVSQVTHGKDPAEAALNDLTSFKKIIQTPIPIYDFIIETTLKKYPDESAFSKKKIAEETMPIIRGIYNPIVLSHYIKRLSHILGVSEESLEKLIAKQKKFNKPFLSNIRVKHSTVNREDLMQKYLISVMLQSEDPYNIADTIFTTLTPTDFSIPALQKIVSLFLKYRKIETEKFNIKDFFNFIPKELHSVGNEVYLYASSDLEMHKESLERLVYEVKKDSLKRQIKSSLEEEISQKEKEEDLLLLQKSLKSVEKILNAL